MVASAMRVNAGGRWWQWLAIGACAMSAVAAAAGLILLGYPAGDVIGPVAGYSLGYLVAGSIAWIRRPGNLVGPVMLATSVAISFSFFASNPEPLVWRLAGISGSVANILVVWIMLAAPAGRLASRVDRLAFVGFAIVVLLVAVLDDLTTRRVVFAAGTLISLALAALVLRRWIVASGPSRRSLAPVVVAGVIAALVHALDFAAGVLLIPVVPGSPIFVADTLTRTLVPFGFLLGLLRLQMGRGAVADLVVELGATPTPERLRDALAGALGDPTLVVVYWSVPFRTYLDGAGNPVDISGDPAGRAVTLLERDGQPSLRSSTTRPCRRILASWRRLEPPSGWRSTTNVSRRKCARSWPRSRLPAHESWRRPTPSGDASSGTSTMAPSNGSWPCHSPSAAPRHSCRTTWGPS